jgi:hypothetical protein
MRILAFGHRRFVGKDTACNLLLTHLRTTLRGKSIAKKGFASKLKAVAHDLWAWAGLKDEDYYEEHPKEKERMLIGIHKTPRDIWIELGNKMREIDDTVWLNQLFLGTKYDILLIKDLRYPNEAQHVMQNNGFCIRIDNPREEHRGDVADNALKDWDAWDRVIVNDGDLASLNQKVIALAEELL